MLKILNFMLILTLLRSSFEVFDGILTSDVLILEWGFSTNASSLDLRSRNINSIEDYAFQNFINLRYLNLQLNNITAVKRNTFSGLSLLNQLYSDSNKIITIENNSFVDLFNLSYLSLNYN